MGKICVMTETMPPPSPSPWPVCLHPLLNDVVPYWRKVIPSTVSVEARVQGSYRDSFLHSSFKPSGFSHQDFSVPQFHRMLRMFNVNVSETSEMVELGLWCSLNLDFNDLSAVIVPMTMTRREIDEADRSLWKLSHKLIVILWEKRKKFNELCEKHDQDRWVYIMWLQT